MYQVNLDYYKSLNVLIVGGQLRSAEMQNEIEEKQAVLDEQAADQMQYQVLRDLKDQKDRNFLQGCNQISLGRFKSLNIDHTPLRRLNDIDSLLAQHTAVFLQ